MQLRRILREAAIAQLLMAEQVLNDVEGMLDHGAHLRQRPFGPKEPVRTFELKIQVTE